MIGLDTILDYAAFAYLLSGLGAPALVQLWDLCFRRQEGQPSAGPSTAARMAFPPAPRCQPAPRG